MQLFGTSTISASATDPLVAIRISDINTPYKLTDTGIGNGGNIDIKTIFFASQNGQITADAFKGTGGNVNINALGFFFSTDSTVTASSKFGLNGNIQINTLVNNSGIIKAVPPTIQLDPEIVSDCQGRAGAASDQFVIIGTGSVARDSEGQAPNNNGWHVNQADNNLEKPSLPNKKIQPIVEAQSVEIEPSGDINLLASPNQLSAVSEASPDKFCLTTGSKPTPVSTLFP